MLTNIASLFPPNKKHSLPQTHGTQEVGKTDKALDSKTSPNHAWTNMFSPRTQG